MADIKSEFFLDVGARQRLLRTATKMRLPLLDDAAVVKYGTNVPGEIFRIGIVRIDDVSNLRRQREYFRIPDRFFAERIKPDVAADETGSQNVWSGEFCRIAIGRPLFVGKRLPQAMHRPLGNLADQLLDRG